MKDKLENIRSGLFKRMQSHSILKNFLLEELANIWSTIIAQHNKIENINSRLTLITKAKDDENGK